MAATSTIARLAVDLIANHARFGRDLKKAHKNAKQFFRQIKRDAKVVKDTVVGIGTAFALALSASAVQAKTFDQSLTKITTQVGIARHEVQGMKKDMVAIANLTGRDVKEMAEGYFFIASAGLRGSTAMRTLAASAKGAAIGLGDTQTVAHASTSVLNAYGAANISAEKATGILLSTVREGKADADSIAKSIGNVIPVASELGVEFHEVGASIAAMTRTGATAEASVTNLSAILSKIQKPSEQAKKALEGVGLTTEDLRVSLREKGLFETLTMLREKFYGNEEALTRVFEDASAVRGIFALVGKSAKENRIIFENLAKAGVGTLSEAFKELQETDAFKIVQAWKAISNSGVVLGGTVLPMVANAASVVANAVINLTEWFNGLDVSQQEFITTAATVAAASIPAIWALGKIGGTVMIAARFMKFFALVSVASIRATSLAIFKNLIPATVAGARSVLLMAKSAAETAVLRLMFWADGIKSAAFKAAFFMRHPVVSARAMAAGTISFFRNMAIGAVDAVKKMALGAVAGFRAMGAAAKTAYLSISWPVVLIGAAIAGAAALFWKFREQIAAALKPIGEFFYNSVFKPIDKVISWIARKFAKFYGWLVQKAASVLDAIGFEKVAQKLRAGGKALEEFSNGSGPVIEQAVMDAGKAAKELAGKAYNATAGLVDKAKLKFKELKEAGGGMIDAVMGAAGMPADPTFSDDGDGNVNMPGMPSDPNTENKNPEDKALKEKAAAEAVKQAWGDVFKYKSGIVNAEGKLDSQAMAARIKNAAMGSKKLGKIMRAAAIAQNIVDTARGVQKAFAEVPFPMNIAQAALVVATGVANMSAIKGQFHDGIDSVPSTGTYLLESGERVVDKRLNRDLSTYLAAQGQQNITNNNRGGDFSPTVNMTIGDNADPEAVFNNRSALKNALDDLADDYAAPRLFV